MQHISFIAKTVCFAYQTTQTNSLRYHVLTEEKALHQEKELLIDERIIENVPLARFTTLQLGGAARYYVPATSVGILQDAVLWAQNHHQPIFVLGGGSNIVVADNGFPGLVIHNKISGYEICASNSKVLEKEPFLTRNTFTLPPQYGDEPILARFGAGQEWQDFVGFCVGQNLAGVECLAGIPGTIGATPIQNVGAYGQEVSETIVSVEAFDLHKKSILELSAAECKFGYRSSRFKTRDRNRLIVTTVTYRLTPNGKPTIRYPELQHYLEEQNINSPSLIDVSHAVETIRRRKAMVIDSNDPDSRSVGSFFVNPTVSQEEFAQVEERAAKYLRTGETMPAFSAANHQVKLSAAWLIERAGITRGYVYGNVGTSTKHALAIINRGNGTAREVIEFSELIKARVLDAFGIKLTLEPVFVGFE